MSYLVTGGTGFIGTEVVKQLSEKGNLVISYDFAPFMPALQRVFGGNPPSNVKVIRGDVTDSLSLFRTIQEYKVERIIHLASLLVPASQANPHLAYQVNCEGTLYLFEAARIFNLPKVVWASSMAVFGHLNQEQQEGLSITDVTPHSPDNIYGACKSFNEHLGLQYNETFSVDTLGIRLGLVYGPGKMRGEGLFTVELIDRPALGKSSNVPFGDDTFNWQYVKDVAHSFVLAADSPPAKRAVLNLEGPVRSVRDAVDIMRQLAPGVDIAIQPGILGFPARIDGAALAKHIDTKWAYTLEKGLNETVGQIRKEASTNGISAR
jgi:nucleoside-diphosphate-sugar epimerase